MLPKKRASARNTIRPNVATQMSHRLHQRGKRGKRGKHWDPIFFQRRDLAQMPLVEHCREIFADRIDDHESGQIEHNHNSGNKNKDCVEDAESRTKLYEVATYDTATAAIGPESGTNMTVQPERYQGQEIGTLFDDNLSHMFLQDWDGSISTWEAKVVRRFFSCEHDEASLKVHSAAWAWLHDWEYSTGQRRTYQSRMGAKDLCSALRRERYGLPGFADVDRRLIYISKLTPSFVRALAVSALYHQTTYLRDAICRHITMETSIRVHFPTSGWKTFCLEFHLAYLILREAEPSSASDITEHEGKSTNKPLIDLEFLGLQSSFDAGPSQHFIKEANISIVVCGWSNTRWTGYAFANTGTEAEEEEEEVDDDDDDDDEDFEPQQDFFAAENGYDEVLDANSPQCDAREYWLRILAIRCELVWKEWQYLVRTVEDAIEAWKTSDPCLTGMGTSDMDARAIRKSLDRTIQAMQLLRTLRDSLSTMLRAYKRFDEPGGDKSYFSDMIDVRDFNKIRDTFQRLADLYLRLGSLSASCRYISDYLGRILDLEANRLTFKSTQLNRETNALNLRSHDLTVESNELTKETNTLNAKSHRLTVESNELNMESHRLNRESNQLNKDSNKINMDNHDLSERTHKLNQRTSVLSDKMREINELSMNAALANQAAAAKTSRSTRVNVELLLFTTPLQMVLQYFGSEKNIFAFNRNPTSFFLVSIVLMVILRFLALLFEHAHSLLRIISWKKSVPSNEETRQPSFGQADDIELEVVQPV